MKTNLILQKVSFLHGLIDPSWIDGNPGQPGPIFHFGGRVVKDAVDSRAIIAIAVGNHSVTTVDGWKLTLRSIKHRDERLVEGSNRYKQGPSFGGVEVISVGRSVSSLGSEGEGNIGLCDSDFRTTFTSVTNSARITSNAKGGSTSGISRTVNSKDPCSRKRKVDDQGAIVISRGLSDGVTHVTSIHQKVLGLTIIGVIHKLEGEGRDTLRVVPGEKLGLLSHKILLESLVTSAFKSGSIDATILRVHPERVRVTFLSSDFNSNGRPVSLVNFLRVVKVNSNNIGVHQRRERESRHVIVWNGEVVEHGTNILTILGLVRRTIFSTNDAHNNGDSVGNGHSYIIGDVPRKIYEKGSVQSNVCVRLGRNRNSRSRQCDRN
jgi:hypothetical protein